jgi:hypothetical protein
MHRLLFRRLASSTKTNEEMVHKLYASITDHIIGTMLVLAFLASISVRCSCENKNTATPNTPTQNIARTWKVNQARKSGAVFTGADFSGFRITFSAAGAYAITRAASPLSPSKTPSQSGTWLLTNNNAQLDFDANSSNARMIGISNLTASTATISWTDDTDKTNPTIAFDLVPAL